MSSLSELEYSALADQTGVSGISLDAQRVIFYDSQTGKSGSNPLQAETAFLIQETGLNTTHSETLWRTYLINRGVTYQANLNDMKRDFWLNYGYQNLSDYIKSLSGLVAYYPLDETSGDAINQAPDTLGTLNGTVTGVTQGAAGLVGTAYSFDGVNDKVVFSTYNPFNIESNQSFFLLINQAALGTRNIFSWDDGSRQLALYNAGSSKLKFSKTTGTSLVTSTSTFLTGTWYAIGYTWDGTTHRLYINGVEDATGLTTPSTGSCTGMKFGNWSGESDPFYSGKMSHYAHFSTVLTPSEHLQLAQIVGLA